MTFQLPKVGDRPVVLLGGGVLGRRIAATWASVGYTVHVRDPSEKQRAEAVAYWKENTLLFPKLLGTNKPAGDVKAFAELEDAIKDAWLIIECVPENLNMKIDTFAQLEKLASPDAILGSNSSSYKSSEMVPNLSDSTKARVLNMHYQMPPQSTLVELMTCGGTAPEIYDFIGEKLKGCGMHPVTARVESTGFVFNRIWAAIKREVISVIAEGVTDAQTIDTIWKARYGSSYGPCEQMDATGLDTVLFIEQHYIKERGLSGKYTVDYLQREFISQGKLGKKSEKGGFYPNFGLQDPKTKEDVPTLYFLDLGVLATQDPLHSGAIIAGKGDGSASKRIIESQSMPDGIDIDDGRLFWSNMGIPSANDGTLQSANLDGSDVKTIVAKGDIHTPKQVTLDKTNKKLYVSDREGMRVMRCNYDGSELETVWKTGDYNDKSINTDQTLHCVGICVDAKNGQFYWTQKGAPKSNQGRIFRAPIAYPAGVDPAARKDVEVIFEHLPEPIDLEVDSKNGFLYWTDRGELPFGNSINRVALKDIVSGSPSEHKHEILVRNLHEAIGLKLDERNGHMYSTDIGGTVYRFNLDGSDRRKMYDEMGAYTGIALVHSS